MVNVYEDDDDIKVQNGATPRWKEDSEPNEHKQRMYRLEQWFPNWPQDPFTIFTHLQALYIQDHWGILVREKVKRQISS